MPKPGRVRSTGGGTARLRASTFRPSENTIAFGLRIDAAVVMGHGFHPHDKRIPAESWTQAVEQLGEIQVEIGRKASMPTTSRSARAEIAARYSCPVLGRRPGGHRPRGAEHRTVCGYSCAMVPIGVNHGAWPSNTFELPGNVGRASLQRAHHLVPGAGITPAQAESKNSKGWLPLDPLGEASRILSCRRWRAALALSPHRGRRRKYSFR